MRAEMKIKENVLALLLHRLDIRLNKRRVHSKKREQFSMFFKNDERKKDRLERKSTSP
jgi:hypothetical protein